MRAMSGAIGLYTIGEIREDFRAAGLGERQARQLAPGLRYELTLQKSLP